MIRIRNVLPVLRLALLGACAAVAISAPAAAEPLKIRADWAVTPGQYAPLIPDAPKYAPGIYKHYGKSYVVEPLRMQGGGATLTALAAGETDLSTLAPASLVLGVVEAKLELRVIAQQLSTEVPGYLHTHYWVRPAEIKRVEDLKGKTVGVNARGANTDVAAQIVLRKHGLEPGRDYQIVEVRFPALLPALESRRIDAAVLVPPFSVMAEAKPEFKPLFSVGDAFGPVETLMWMAKADWVAKNRAALVDFLEDNLRLRRWIFDPKTRPDAIKLLSAVTKIPEKAYEGWVFTTRDYYSQPDGMVDVARLQKNVNDMKAAGMFPTAIDVAPYVDLSLVREAAARLGRN